MAFKFALAAVVAGSRTARDAQQDLVNCRVSTEIYSRFKEKDGHFSTWLDPKSQIIFLTEKFRTPDLG